jgi:uncharacterized phage-associated protein
MITDHKREKLLNLIVYFVKNTKNCGKTKLFKLLYFADFECFKKTGKSITGLDYFTWPKGPVPIELFNEFKTPTEDFMKYFSATMDDLSDRLNIKPKYGIKFEDRHFNKIELKIIEEMAFIYKEALAEDMIEITHLKNSPWHKTLRDKGKNKRIDYMLAFDGEKESLSLEKYETLKDENDTIEQILFLCTKEK